MNLGEIAYWTTRLTEGGIAIPKYTVMQTVVSQAMKQERERITSSLQNQLSESLSAELVDLASVLPAIIF